MKEKEEKGNERKGRKRKWKKREKKKMKEKEEKGNEKEEKNLLGILQDQGLQWYESKIIKNKEIQ